MIFNSQNGAIGLNAKWFGAHTVEDIKKVTTAVKNYNLIAEQSIVNAQKYAASIGVCDEKFGNYLKGLNGANASMKGYIASLVGATIKTVALEAASAALNAVLTWGISVAIQGLILGLQALWKLIPTTKNLKSNLEETFQELADVRSEQETLNDELKTTRDRIAELESKGKLSFTDEAELQKLKQQNAEIERQNELLEDKKEKKREEAVEDFNNYFNRQKSQEFSSWYNPEEMSSSVEYLKELGQAYHDAKMSDDGSFTHRNNGIVYYTEDIQGMIDDAREDINNYQEYLSKLYDNGFIYSSADEEAKKNVDFVNEMIDVYMVLIGKSDALWSQIYNRDKFAEARDAIKDLGDVTAESLSKLYNDNDKVKELIDYCLSLGSIDWKSILGDEEFGKLDTNADGTLEKYELFDQATGKCKVSSDGFKAALGLVANEFKAVEEASESATDSAISWKNISESVSGMIDKYDALKAAQEELKESGALSAETLDELAKKYPELSDAIGEYAYGLISQEELMSKLQNAYNADYSNYRNSMQAKLDTSTECWNKILSTYPAAINSISKAYNVDLKNCKTIEEAKAKIRLAYMNEWMKEYNKYVELNLNEAQQLRKDLSRRNRNGQYDKKIADLDAYIKLLQGVNKDFGKVLPTPNVKKLSTKSVKKSTLKSTKSTEDKNKKKFDKLKYLLETNQITEEEYLKRLDKAYKKYYGNKKKYLEEYSQYSQEVYDGFKNMYKEDLEAQKESWEKKKDAVSEYYDDLIKQIEDSHDKEDYEKEQSEKRKEIFDLDMQIAELMRDGSEKAKARIAELEEERVKAEEELLNFETDKARENESNRLEKEKETEEKKIQDKIDGVQKQLDELNKDTTSIRKAIIKYAEKKGVSLNFAYASGTCSSVGGFGRINEKGTEMIAAPDVNGSYVNLMPNSYVFPAKATAFLWKLATERSLPQAMYNSIAKSFKAQGNTPSVNVAQPIAITMGDIIVKGSADKQTVADIKKQQENTVRMVLQKIKELQK